MQIDFDYSKKTDAEKMLERYFMMSRDEIKKTIPPIRQERFEPSFEVWCQQKHGVSVASLQHKVLNGMACDLFRPCLRGTRSDLKHIKPGQDAREQLDSLSRQYQEAIATGEVKVHVSYKDRDFTLISDVAHLNIVVRRSVQKAIRLNQVQNVHEDHKEILSRLQAR